MIDFGLMTEYLDNKGVHYPQSDVGFTGTPLTGSNRSLAGKSHSRRDDLESLGYTFLFLINPDAIPWGNELQIAPILEKMQIFISADSN